MGKKGARKPYVPGIKRDGPNRQVKPPKPPTPQESESEDSFVLDEPVGDAHLPLSSSESEDEMPVEKPTVMVQVKQVYKNPAAGTNLYGPMPPDSNVVSANAMPSEIEYKIEILPFEKKKKHQEPAWIESMFTQRRNRNPPTHYQRANFQKTVRPIQPHMLRAPVPMAARNSPASAPTAKIKQDVEENDWDMRSVAESLPQSIVASSPNWETESIASCAWDNEKITFK